MPSPAPGVPADKASTTVNALFYELQIAAEFTSGYDRDLFEHWTDADSDGCDTRAEVLFAETLTLISCSLGQPVATCSWYSAYDAETSK